MTPLGDITAAASLQPLAVRVLPLDSSPAGWAPLSRMRRHARDWAPNRGAMYRAAPPLMHTTAGLTQTPRMGTML